MARLFLCFTAGCAVGAALFLTAGRTVGDCGERFFTSRAARLLSSLLLGVAIASASGVWSGASLALASCALCAALFHALTDLSSGYIYDRAVWASIVAACAVRLPWQGADAFPAVVFGTLAGWLPLALIVLLSRGGMGWGDASLMAGVGALLGWKLTLISLYAGVMAGGACALVLLAARRVGRRDALPLAPFLAVGVLAALLWGADVGRLFGLNVDF